MKKRVFTFLAGMATDYMVFNVTKDEIDVRMSAVDEDIWPEPSDIPLIPPDVNLQRTFMSEYYKEGRVVHKDILEVIYDEINQMYGINEKVPD